MTQPLQVLGLHTITYTLNGCASTVDITVTGIDAEVIMSSVRRISHTVNRYSGRWQCGAELAFRQLGCTTQPLRQVQQSTLIYLHPQWLFR